ncbi:MAG: CoB--CoM heterodisulfide reductase iron-sulfur subunit A family protein, partial [Firmicutes bacterium]|nr:CoB--CoM heterodisulfide reductase iron-sulfur subunit A family protein [Bacillota bacterium]
WVHMHEPAKATEKAKDLVRMAVAKAARLEPVPQVKVGVTPAALVIGGGVAGMNAALSLAEQGFEVHLVEKQAELGGVARRLPRGLNGEDVPRYLEALIGRVTAHPRIKVHTGTEVVGVSGYKGNFTTRLANGTEVKHGATIIAVGGREYRPTEYLYGQDPRVMTFLEMGEELAKGNGRVAGAKNVVLIQCVGSREEPRLYCSRVCCGKAVRLALELKERDPEANVYVLYRDVRTYGFLEDHYREARAKGVVFIRYTVEEKPRVEVRDGRLVVTVKDHVLGVPVEVEADAVGLGAAILPPEDAGKLSQFFKVPLNEDGFFLEAHLKLRPVDFAAEGVFLCGLAHGPKSLEENIAQAKAAAGRAGT